MEIKFKNIDLKVQEDEITCILDESKLIKNNLDSIEFDNNKKLKYIESNFLTKTISDEFFLIKREIEDDNYIEKVISSLNIVGLNEDYLTREINTLSYTEKVLLSISLALVTNPDIIIFDNIFNNLDKKYKMIIKNLIKELKKKYNKIIILIDNDINILYEIGTYLVIIKDNKVIANDNMKNVFKSLEIFEENNLEIPFLIEFSYIANNYNKKINYHKDINDLIKDVYKNVK